MSRVGGGAGRAAGHAAAGVEWMGAAKVGTSCKIAALWAHGMAPITGTHLSPLTPCPLPPSLYFGESNVEGMLNTLLPLHEMMRKQGPTTLKEIAFVQVGALGAAVLALLRRPACVVWSGLVTLLPFFLKLAQRQTFLTCSCISRPAQAYGRELDEAYEWCLKYKQSRKVRRQWGPCLLDSCAALWAWHAGRAHRLSCLPLPLP